MNYLSKKIQANLLGTILLSTSAFAFNPTASGWYGENDANITTSQFSAPTADGSTGGPSGATLKLNSSQFGLELKQTIGYKNLITLDILGGFSHSLGSTTNTYGFSMNNRILELRATCYSSLNLTKERDIFIEPALGYECLKQTQDPKAGPFIDKATYKKVYCGPSLGLYVRFYPQKKLSLRAGSRYIMTRLKVSKSAEDESESIGSNIWTGAQHGLGTTIDLNYAVRSWVGFNLGLEYQSFSASKSIFEQYTARTLVRWGANFCY